MKTQTGKLGEKIAEKYLVKKGYKIISRNFRIRGGEIDLIVIKDNTVVYVEVKTRTGRKFGLPEESVGKHKLYFLERTSQFFRQQNPELPKQERIDVIAVELKDNKCKLKHIQNAHS